MLTMGPAERRSIEAMWAGNTIFSTQRIILNTVYHVFITLTSPSMSV